MLHSNAVVIFEHTCCSLLKSACLLFIIRQNDLILFSISYYLLDVFVHMTNLPLITTKLQKRIHIIGKLDCEHKGRK